MFSSFILVSIKKRAILVIKSNKQHTGLGNKQNGKSGQGKQHSTDPGHGTKSETDPGHSTKPSCKKHPRDYWS